MAWDNLYVGVPVIIGAGGVEQVVEIDLDDEAKGYLQVSVDAVKELLVACKAIDGSPGIRTSRPRMRGAQDEPRRVMPATARPAKEERAQ